jgi:hypothetical protein
MANATSPLHGGRGPAAPPAPAGDLPTQVADTIDRVVGTVRDATTGRALTVARAIVYGTFAAIVSTAVLVTTIVFLVRIIDNYLPGDVWATYLLLGGIFTVCGIVLWSRRNAPAGR